MAENKRSFVLYADYITTFSHLTKEEKGTLLELIFDYVNDKNPVCEDRIVNIAFEPIKQQLKRDLKSWEKIRKKRSIAGKKGGEASAANRTKANQIQPNASFAQANQAVTVTVNDNVNDNVIKIRQNFDILESQQIWKEQTMMALKLDSTKFKIAFDSFKAQHIMAGQVKPLSELMDHFSKWYPKAKANLFNTQTTQIYNKI